MNTIIHEIINYQPNIPIKLFYQRIGSVSKHWHSSIEILFVLQGTMTVIIEDTTWELKEDDIFLINPNHIHETHSQDCSLIVVQIRLAEFGLDWAIPENIQFNCNSADNKFSWQHYFTLKHLIVMLLKNTSVTNEFSQLSNYSCAVSLIRELCQNFKQEQPVPAPHSIKYLNRLKSILDYINKNYMTPVTLTDIARREFLTPTYLSAFFEKTMGTPLYAYITKVRLGHAVFDLMNTEDSIEAIASRNGFASARSFSSVFKKNYRMLPSEYRRQAKQENYPVQTLTRDMGIGAVAGSRVPLSGSNTAGSRNAQAPHNAESSASPFPVPLEYQNSYLELEHYDFLNKLAPYIQPAPPAENAANASAATDQSPHAFDGNRRARRNDLGSFKEKRLDLGNLQCSAMPDRQLTQSFKGFCGVSRASELLLPPVQEMIRRIQREIGFKYIKFHGILDDDLMVCRRDKGGQLIFNYTYVDMILDFLLENDLKPMIQFSFMPAALASEPQHTVFEKPVIISPPASKNEWCRLITCLTSHFIDRYGTHEVRSWIFTFWNEILNGLSFDFKDSATALELYQLTRQCVKDCDAQLCFAGTSYSALTFPEDGYDIFLDFARKNQCLPDAYIFHFYPVVVDNNAFSTSARQWKAQDYTKPVALSRDPDIFHQFLEHMAARLPEAAQAPVYITEWNFSPSHREWLNDTCFCACYLVRNLLQNFHKAAGFCHWCLTDLHQELPMPDALFHGGMGLFTRNAIPKPSYYAYSFLNRLYPHIVSETEGCFISTNGQDFSFLLYNYYHFNNLYGHGISFDTTPENWQRAFPDASPLRISFHLDDIDDGAYTLTEEFVTPDCGSAFEVWLSMGRPALNTPGERELLAGHACPGFHQRQANVSGRGFLYEATLVPHEIRFVKLCKSQLYKAHE